MNNLKKYIAQDWKGGLIEFDRFSEAEINELIALKLIELEIRISSIDLDCDHRFRNKDPKQDYFFCEDCFEKIPKSECTIKKYLKVNSTIPHEKACNRCAHSRKCIYYLPLKKAVIKRTMNENDPNSYVPEYTGVLHLEDPFKALALNCQDYMYVMVKPELLNRT